MALKSVKGTGAALKSLFGQSQGGQTERLVINSVAALVDASLSLVGDFVLY